VLFGIRLGWSDGLPLLLRLTKRDTMDIVQPPKRGGKMTKARVLIVIGVLSLFTMNAYAASACQNVDNAWLTWVANGTTVSYGYTVDGTAQNSKTVSSVGVIKMVGSSVVASQGASLITGTVSGTEKQNVGGTVTTLSFGGPDSTFSIDTNDCTGTLTRKFTNGSVVVWHIAAVDGTNTIRYMDTRSSVRTGALQLMN
jgi:hypothetical protein